MNKIYLLVLLFCLFTSQAAAQEEGEAVPEGMKVIESGRAKLLVPEDARITETDGYIKVEDTAEYAARKFTEMKRRLDKIEAEEQAMKQELARLKKVMEEMQSRSTAIEQSSAQQETK